MSRRTKDAERHFGESLRARPLRPVVETDYMRLVAARKARRSRNTVLASLAFWVISLTICGTVVSL